MVRWRYCLETRERRHIVEHVTGPGVIYITNGDGVLGDCLQARFTDILDVR